MGATIFEPTPEKVIGLLAVATFAISVGAVVIGRRSHIASVVVPASAHSPVLGGAVSRLAVAGGILFILWGVALLIFAAVAWLGPAIWGDA